jgi:diadenosine tetraphosphate (Ap4A) HIT family hydrolase
MSPKMSCSCEICAELAGSPSRFSSIYSGRLTTRLVAGSENFVVMPSIGQLGDGHLMIVSRSHKTAVATLSADHREELASLISHTRSWLKLKLDANNIVFENGDPNGLGLMSCSVSHLHVHLVAYRHGVGALTQAVQQLEGKKISSLAALSGTSDAYSFVDMEHLGIQLIRRRLPSQTLRRIIAQAIGLPRWDWREASTEDQLNSIARVARADLASGNGFSFV